MKALLTLIAIAALALPASALGKGPTAATMDGPGGGGITFSGDEGSGPLGSLVQQSGWFAAVFEQTPNPMLAARPKGDLGPKYTVTYTVPGPYNDTFIIRQDIYPYANAGPVAYLAPNQRIFDMTTPGGWFQAGPELKQTLVAAGLPESAPAVSSEDDSSFPTATVSLLVFAFVFVMATALLVRRRARPAAV